MFFFYGLVKSSLYQEEGVNANRYCSLRSKDTDTRIQCVLYCHCYDLEAHFSTHKKCHCITKDCEGRRNDQFAFEVKVCYVDP